MRRDASRDGTLWGQEEGIATNRRLGEPEQVVTLGGWMERWNKGRAYKMYQWQLPVSSFLPTKITQALQFGIQSFQGTAPHPPSLAMLICS